MAPDVSPVYRSPLLLAAGTLAVLVAAAELLPGQLDTPAGVTAAVLLAAFGLLFLVFRHGHIAPAVIGYLGVQSVIIVSLLLLLPEHSDALILANVLSVQAALLLSPPAVAGWLGVFTLITAWYLIGPRQAGAELGSWVDVVGTGVGYGAYIVIGAAVRAAERARQHNQRLLADLQAAHQQLQRFTSQAQDLAVAQERNRLAREMHDALGHTLTVSVVQLEGAQRLIAADPGRAARIVGELREQLKSALAELRRAVSALHTPLEGEGALEMALHRLAARFETGTGLRVHVDVPASLPPLPPLYRLALYRAAQEGLTNVQRHARARQAWLTLSGAAGDAVHLSVADDGQGILETPEASGTGLSGLRERAAQLGGQLEVAASPRGGLELRLALPVPAVAS